MKLSQEGRIIELCNKHNWPLTAEQLEIIKKVVDMEQLEAAMSKLDSTPSQFISDEAGQWATPTFHSPRKKAKEIALDAAIKMCSKSDCGEDDILEVAKKIYTWLIEEPKKQTI